MIEPELLQPTPGGGLLPTDLTVTTLESEREAAASCGVGKDVPLASRDEPKLNF